MKETTLVTPVRTMRELEEVTHMRWLAYSRAGYSPALLSAIEKVNPAELEPRFGLYQARLDGQVVGTIRGVLYEKTDVLPPTLKREWLPPGRAGSSERYAVLAPAEVQAYVKTALALQVVQWNQERGADYICVAALRSLVPGYKPFGLDLVEASAEGIHLPDMHRRPFLTVMGETEYVIGKMSAVLASVPAPTLH